MTDSRRLDLVQAVFSTLQTALSTPSFFKRRYLRELDPDGGDCPAYSVYAVADRLRGEDQESHGSGVQIRELEVVIEGRFTGEPVEDVVDSAVRTIERTVAADVTWGGLAQHTSWDVAFDAEEDAVQAWAGFKVSFRITYIHDLIT